MNSPRMNGPTRAKVRLSPATLAALDLPPPGRTPWPPRRPKCALECGRSDTMSRWRPPATMPAHSLVTAALALLVLAMGFCSSAQAAVYRCPQEGRTTYSYSDQPCPVTTPAQTPSRSDALPARADAQTAPPASTLAAPESVTPTAAMEPPSDDSLSATKPFSAAPDNWVGPLLFGLLFLHYLLRGLARIASMVSGIEARHGSLMFLILASPCWLITMAAVPGAADGTPMAITVMTVVAFAFLIPMGHAWGLLRRDRKAQLAPAAAAPARPQARVDHRSPAAAKTWTVCPRCSHTRTGRETTPAHTCPGCGVVYEKFEALQMSQAQIASSERLQLQQQRAQQPSAASRRWSWSWLVYGVVFVAIAHFGALVLKYQSQDDTPRVKRNIEQLLAMMAEDGNKNLPRMVDTETRADQVIVGPGKRLTTLYTMVDYSYEQLDSEVFSSEIRASLRGFYCGQKIGRELLEAGVVMAAVYRDRARIDLARIEVRARDCGA